MESACKFHQPGSYFLKRVLCLLLGVTIPFAFAPADSAFAQAASPVNSAPAPGGQQMRIPAPVQSGGYPTAVRAEVRSNYVSGGATFSTSYIDNYYGAVGANAISETTYSLYPTIALDHSTSRHRATLRYAPGFTVYQPSSELNEFDQNAAVDYSYRPTPHSTISIGDNFVYSSTLFNSMAAGLERPVSGSIETVSPVIVAPFVRRRSNDARGEYTLQTSETSLFGFSGTITMLQYPKSADAVGLYDSKSHGGAGFYSARISGGQYLGALYDFSQVYFYPASGKGQTQIHSAAGFYTVYPTEDFSVSIMGGAQHYRLTDPSAPEAASWGPSVSASTGWQALHTSIAASYSYGITSGGGWLGAFHSNVVNATLRHQLSRSLSAGVNAEYSDQKSVTKLLGTSYQDGHTVSGAASLQYNVGSRMSFEFGYDRIHESYGWVTATTIIPDSNRVTAALSWRFTHPWGR